MLRIRRKQVRRRERITHKALIFRARTYQHLESERVALPGIRDLDDGHVAGRQRLCEHSLRAGDSRRTNAEANKDAFQGRQPFVHEAGRAHWSDGDPLATRKNWACSMRISGIVSILWVYLIDLQKCPFDIKTNHTPPPEAPACARWSRVAVLLALSSYLLLAHGCHTDEDHELFKVTHIGVAP